MSIAVLMPAVRLTLQLQYAYQRSPSAQVARISIPVAKVNPSRLVGWKKKNTARIARYTRLTTAPRVTTGMWKIAHFR